jgi:hypothetical protein
MTYYEVEGDMERLIKYFGDDLQLMWWFTNWLSYPLVIKERMTEIELRNMVRCYADQPELLESLLRGFSLYMQHMMNLGAEENL